KFIRHADARCYYLDRYALPHQQEQEQEQHISNFDAFRPPLVRMWRPDQDVFRWFEMDMNTAELPTTRGWVLVVNKDHRVHFKNYKFSDLAKKYPLAKRDKVFSWPKIWEAARNLEQDTLAHYYPKNKEKVAWLNAAIEKAAERLTVLASSPQGQQSDRGLAMDKTLDKLDRRLLLNMRNKGLTAKGVLLRLFFKPANHILNMSSA
ncbi:hypothetical protein, partial [Asticcacaulis sp.]|uniref:hypothetical protein n=1 Tax=Asticcacaulis sp. TaxID=1872648 RepID=UPI00262BC261